jgi:hypothetical protein
VVVWGAVAAVAAGVAELAGSDPPGDTGDAVWAGSAPADSRVRQQTIAAIRKASLPRLNESVAVDDLLNPQPRRVINDAGPFKFRAGLSLIMSGERVSGPHLAQR